MDKNYTINWRNAEKTILEINYLGDSVLSDVLSSNVEGFAMIESLPHEAVLVHNDQGHSISLELLGVGKIHDSVYSKFPPVPKDLKSVIVILSSFGTRKMMGAAMEVLDKLFFGRKMVHTVSSMEEANVLIARAGF